VDLYIRHAADRPHAQNPDLPAETLCTRPMVGMKRVTEAQVLVHMKNDRCPICFPGWSTHKGHLRG
jgi:hypothetical protein